MRVTIQTLGTRGDVQPYVALARTLQSRGHDVQLAAPAQFEGFITDQGVEFAGLPGEFLALLETPEGKAAVAGSKGFGAGFKLLKHVRPMMTELLMRCWQSAQTFRPDLIIHHPKSLGSPHIAQALNIPHVLASPLPGFTPTSDFPSPMLPFASLGPLNRVSHLLAIHGGGLLFGKDLQAWRQNALELGARKPASPLATLYAYSPAVVPVPHDWGEDVLVTGYWFLDDPSWEADPALAAFLSRGEQPVYFGFGSMPGLDPTALTDLIVQALSLTGKRGLLLASSGALYASALPAYVHMVQSAPHDRLLPYVSATVHHGGAGTTAAALRIGKPTTIIPFFGDQPFWGRRVFELSAGPKPIDLRELSVDHLVAALIAMDGPAVRQAAGQIGAAIAKEDGVGRAVDFVESRYGALSRRTLMQRIHG